MHYITKINNASGKIGIKFNSMGVTLMRLSSLDAAYGPGDYWYIPVVIETTQTCLDLGCRLRKRLRCCFSLQRYTWKFNSRCNDILYVAVE